MKRAVLFSLFTCAITFSLLAQLPTISSFAPQRGTIGTTVTITGNNFSLVPTQNHVYFGSAKANIVSSSANTITAVVPKGATFERLSVAVDGKVAYTDPFRVIFTSSGLDGTTFAGLGANFTTGSDPWAVASGDIDLDGKIDIVTSNYSGNSVSVLRNTTNGPGNFSYSKEDFLIGLYSYGVTIGDVDGDGKLDIVTGSYVESAPTLSVFHNTSMGPGDINFTKYDFPTGHGPKAFAIGDIDGDGKPDISLACELGAGIHINTGTGGSINFPYTGTIGAGQSPRTIAIADLDGDSKADLVTGNDGNPEGISVLKNNTTVFGNPSFTKTIYAAASPVKLSIADLDGDSKPDLIASNDFSPYLTVYLNVSSGSNIQFGEQVKIGMPSVMGAHAIADLDGDSKIDIAVKSNSGVLIVLKNTTVATGAVTFGPRIELASNGATSISDQDGDGKPELLIVPGLGGVGNSVTILRNKITGKIDQTITFAPLATKKFGDSPFQLSANASSGLPVSFTSSDPSRAIIENNVVTILGAGSIVISAKQEGDETFNEAPLVSHELIISKAQQVLSFPVISPKTLGDAVFQLSATATSGLPVQFSSASDKISLNGADAKILAAGVVMVNASQAGNHNYAAAENKSQSFCVAPKRPTITAFQLVGGDVLLTSNDAAGIHWYFNTEEIADATEATYHTTESGTYTVRVRVDTCWSEFSAPAIVVITGLEERTDRRGTFIYPTFAKNFVTIYLPESSAIESFVTITSMGGHEVRDFVMQGETETIDVSSFDSGIYFVSVRRNSRSFVSKFIKE